MKKSYIKLRKLVANEIVNVEDYYSIRINRGQIYLQGIATMSVHVDLISKGFSVKYDDQRKWTLYIKADIEIILCDK